MSLSTRHLKDLHLPDKAIDVIDEAGAAKKLQPRDAAGPKGPAPQDDVRDGAGPKGPAPQDDVRDAAGPKGPAPQDDVRGAGPSGPALTVTVADIEKIVAKIARVPVQAVSSDDKVALRHIDVELKSVIFGQDAAIGEVASAIKLSRSGLRAPDKPMGSFLFAGPTGVGKTELAKQLARILKVEFLRFDMSEYMEKHAVSRLIGAPPGYVGYEEGGLLIDAVRKAPHAVLLLDEIEKAHPDLFAILLQVMDHATLTDTHGRHADFRHVILIMTTNAGARDLAARNMGFFETSQTSKAAGVIERMFAPEFRNRLDAVVNFSPLGTQEIGRVVDKHLDELRQLVAGRRITNELTPAARGWLAEKGFDKAFGARPMARLVEKAIKKPLSELLLFEDVKDGERVVVDVQGDGLQVKRG